MSKRLIGTKAVITIGGMEMVSNAVYVVEESRVPEALLEPEKASWSGSVELTRSESFNYEDDDLSDVEPLEYSDCYD